MVHSHKLSNFDLISLLSTIVVAYFLSDYTQLSKNLTKEANELNNTRKSNTSFLIFNRTPKAGSETIWGLLDNLQEFNNFTSYSDSPEVKKERGRENTFLTLENGIVVNDQTTSVSLFPPLFFPGKGEKIIVYPGIPGNSREKINSIFDPLDHFFLVFVH